MSVQAIITDATGYVYGSQVEILALYENKTTEGLIKTEPMKYDGANCHINPADIYEDGSSTVTKWNLKNMLSEYVTGLGIFNYGCIRTSGCKTGGYTPCTAWDTAAGSFKWGILIRGYDPTQPNPPPNLVVTPQSGALNITWGPVTNVEVFAYQVRVWDASTDGSIPAVAGYTESSLRNITVGELTNGKTYVVHIEALSHSRIFSAGSEKTGTPAGATNAVVYNIYTAPDAPKAGDSITITAEIANTGPNGKVRAVFKVGGTQISDQNSTLVTFQDPGRVLWKPTAPYTMPNATITIIVEAYGWDGTKWVLTDTKSITRTPSAVPCSGVTLTPFTASIKIGEKVTFTAAVTPSTTAFDVQFKDRAGTVLGTCKTSGGSCTFIWDSAGKAVGAYYVKASVAQGSCVSTESTIQVAQVINQWNVNIYVKDSVTNAPVSGATVLVGTQTKTTDATGLTAFRVDEGQIYITISKSGYNPFTPTTELVFMDKTFNYVLAPTAAAKGSIQFVSVPVGAEIFLDGADQGVKTPFTVTDIPTGVHAFTLKLAGYNDTSGSVTVVGGTVIQVYVVLSPATPTTGSLYTASMPLGAEIFIDGNPTDPIVTTPAMVTNLTAGSHTVKLTKTGYQDWTGTVNIVAGTTQYINPTLTPLTTTGSLEINSVPQGARVYLDDVDQTKVTPATILNLTAGSHPYKLVLSGYGDATGTVTIEAGKTTMLTVTLKKTEEAGVSASTAIGLVAVAVVAVAVVAASR